MKDNSDTVNLLHAPKCPGCKSRHTTYSKITKKWVCWMCTHIWPFDNNNKESKNLIA